MYIPAVSCVHIHLAKTADLLCGVDVYFVVPRVVLRVEVTYVCIQLLSERELSEVASALYFIVLEKLCTEHFHTALDIALAGNSIHVYGNFSKELELVVRWSSSQLPN